LNRKHLALIVGLSMCLCAVLLPVGVVPSLDVTTVVSNPTFAVSKAELYITAGGGSDNVVWTVNSGGTGTFQVSATDSIPSGVIITWGVPEIGRGFTAYDTMYVAAESSVSTTSFSVRMKLVQGSYSWISDVACKIYVTGSTNPPNIEQDWIAPPRPAPTSQVIWGQYTVKFYIQVNSRGSVSDLKLVSIRLDIYGAKSDNTIDLNNKVMSADLTSQHSGLTTGQITLAQKYEYSTLWDTTKVPNGLYYLRVTHTWNSPLVGNNGVMTLDFAATSQGNVVLVNPFSTVARGILFLFGAILSGSALLMKKLF